MSDLPPDVRDQAANAAWSAYLNTGLAASNPEHWARIADAVAAVVRPEIEREAAARVDELTEALDTAIEALGWAGNYIAVPWPKAYQVEPLRAALAAAVEEREQ